MNAQAIFHPVRAFRSTPRFYRLQQRLKRLALAWRYLTGTWTEDDAGWIAYEAHQVAGYAVLETVDVDGVVEWAEERFGEHPKMREWARTAVRRVGNKWVSTGDAASAAQDWAVDLIQEYASYEGVELVEKED